MASTKGKHLMSTITALFGSAIAGAYAAFGSAEGLFNFFVNALGLGWLS